MPDVSRTKVFENRWRRGDALPFDHLITDNRVELVEGRLSTTRDVVYLSVYGIVFDGCREQVCLHGVVNVNEVAGRFTVAHDDTRLVHRKTRDPLGNYRSVGSLRILPLAEDVEISQSDGLQPIDARENSRIDLIHQHRRGIRRKRFSNAIFAFDQSWIVAVDGAG